MLFVGFSSQKISQRVEDKRLHCPSFCSKPKREAPWCIRYYLDHRPDCINLQYLEKVRMETFFGTKLLSM